jgi:hypothetical protein
MTRTDYIYQFQGLILKKRLALASPTSKYAGQAYYVLTLKKSDHTRQSIQVFKPKLASAQIWTAIEQGDCLSQNYLLYCRNQKGYYYLVNWEQKPPSPAKTKDHDLN